MNEEEQIEPQENNEPPVVKKKKKKWFRNTVVGIIVFFVFFDVFLYFFATPVLKNYIREKVLEKTQGLYYINFDKIRMELMNRQVVLTDFTLIPDTVVYNQLLEKGVSQPAVYDISVKSVLLQGTSFYNLLFKQFLDVKKIVIEQPEISLKKLPKKSRKNIESRDFIHEDFYASIKQYVNVLQIEYVDIQDGHFRLRMGKDNKSRVSHYGTVSIRLYDFYLDEQISKTKKKLFYSNDIQVFISDYRIRLSDGLHNFYAENIYISTKENILKANSVSILPASDLRRYKKNLTSDYYYFFSPQISFHNFNIANLYFNKNIEIRNIIVDKPRIKLVDVQKKGLKETKGETESDKEKEKKKKTSGKKDLYRLIKNSLNSVSIKTLDLKHAEIEFFYNSHMTKPAYRIKDFDLSLLDFLLDAHSAEDKTRILYSKNIRLNLKDFKAKISNKTHNLRARQINIHTDTKSLYIRDLNIHPAKNQKFLKLRMDIDVKDVKLSGTDFYDLIKKRELVIKKMILGKSNINIRREKQDNPEKAANFVDNLTNAFLKKLSIYNLQLKKSNFNIVEYQKDSVLGSYRGLVNFDIRYLNFYRSGRGFKKMFSIYGFKIALSDYKQQITDRVHLLEADNVYVSNTDSVIELDNLVFHPKVRTYALLKNYHQPDIVDLHIKKTALTGVDLHKLFLQEDLRIDQILIDEPLLKTIHYKDITKVEDTIVVPENFLPEQDSTLTDTVLIPKTLNGWLSKYFKSFSVNKLNINKANFLLTEADSLDILNEHTSGKLSLKLSGFNYDYYADTLNFGRTETGDLNFEIDDFYEKLPDNTYWLKTKNIRFSQKDSLLSAKIVRWFPNEDTADSLFGKSIITAYSPEISFRGIDINRFSNTNILHLGTLRITEPAISLLKNEYSIKKQQDSATIEKSFPLERIITDSIIIAKGSFGVLKNKDNPDDKLLNTGFSIYLSELQIDSSFAANPAKQIKNVATIFHLQNFKYTDSVKNFTFDFNHFYMSSDKKLILFDNVLYYSGKNNDKKTLQTLFVPVIKLSGFSYPDLLDHNFIGDSLQIISPYIIVLNKEKKKTKKINPLEINLYEKTKKVFEKIDLKTIDINNAALQVNNEGNISNPVSHFDNIFGTISNLFIDSLHQKSSERLFNTSDISFSMQDYSFTVAKGTYQIDIGAVGFSTGKKQVFVKATSVNPTATREEMERKAKTEVKMFYVNAPEIIFNNLDFRSLIAENKLITDRVDLNHVKFHFYKNKHFPMDSSLKSPMPLRDLQKVKTYIKVDTVNIHDFYVGVELLGENSTHTGYFDITEIEAVVTNITNDKALIDSGLITKINAEGKIMDEGFLKASFRIPLGNKDGEYYYGGKLWSMRASALNPLLENFYFTSIKDGMIDSIEFKVSANDDYAEGSMKAVYENLKFNILNKKKTDSLIVNKRGFVSMLANSIIRNDNPKRQGGRVKPVRIYYERDIYRPVFHYWTMTLLNGIKTTMGFKSKELKERLKWEKIYEKNKRIFVKREKKINRKEKRKNEKEISKDLKADLRNEEKEKKKKDNK